MPINQFTQQSNFLLAAMAGAERIFEAMRWNRNRTKVRSGWSTCGRRAEP